MGPRAALAVAVAALAVALVGCDANFTGGDDTTSGGSDMGVHVSDMATVQCAMITIGATDPMTGQPTSNAPAHLTASVDVFAASGVHWSLQHDNDTPVTPTPTDSTGFHVEYDADAPGTWTFSVHFDVGPCPGTNFKNLASAQSVQQFYRFRVLPPETLGRPLTDTMVIVSGGANQTKDLVIADGTSAPGTFKIAGSAAPGEVRFIADPSSGGPDAIAFAGMSGAFTAVLGSGDYTPLLIPQATAPAIPRAPHLGAKAASTTFPGAVFDIPGGVAVSGSFVDNAAAAIAGARMVLRAGALPSGPGVSDGAGAFTLYAEPSTYTMSFGAPDWPEGSVDGVVVPAGGTTASVTYTIGRVAVGGSVTGENPAGARVTITSHDPLANVADVVVGGSAPVHASGRVARVLFANADGSLPPFQLPLGSYDVLVEPAGPSLNQGLTVFTETVTGPATWTLALARPVALTVTVTGHGAPVQGAQLTAFETVGLGAAPTGTTDANGQYTFTLDRDAPLSLLVEPRGSDKLAGLRQGVAAGGGAVAVMLGPGLQVSGVVRTSSPSVAVPGVRVEALCWSCGSTTPLATAISDASGVYRIYLPDPGLVPLDGGVTD